MDNAQEQGPDRDIAPDSPLNVPPLPGSKPPASRPDPVKPEVEAESDPQPPLDTPATPPVLPGH